jgi:hypothetical protein
MLGDKNYPYLFWDGHLDQGISFGFESGYCVAAEDTMAFLEAHASRAGLDQALVTDFVTFWTPYLQQSPYHLIRFLTPAECDQVAKLSITSPTGEVIPATRFYMVFKPVEQAQSLPEPVMDFPSHGTVPQAFDWGGFSV